MMPSTRRIFESILGSLGNISDALRDHNEFLKMQREINQSLHQRLLQLERHQ